MLLAHGPHQRVGPQREDMGGSLALALALALGLAPGPAISRRQRPFVVADAAEHASVDHAPGHPIVQAGKRQAPPKDVCQDLVGERGTTIASRPLGVPANWAVRSAKKGSGTTF